MTSCERCEKLMQRLAKVLKENDDLHKLVAHYRSRAFERRLMAQAPPTGAKH